MGADLHERINQLRAQLEEVNRTLTRLRRDQRLYKRNFDLVVANAYCPVCLQPLSLEYKYEYSEKIARIIRENERRIAVESEHQRALEQEILNLEKAMGNNS